MISYHLRHLIYFIVVLEMSCSAFTSLQSSMISKNSFLYYFQQPVDVSLADLKIFGKGIQGKIFPAPVLFDIF